MSKTVVQLLAFTKRRAQYYYNDILKWKAGGTSLAGQLENSKKQYLPNEFHRGNSNGSGVPLFKSITVRTHGFLWRSRWEGGDRFSEK